MKIALVTEELAIGSSSGGIGGAFHELALLLARSNHDVEIIYASLSTEETCITVLKTYYGQFRIRVTLLPVSDYVWDSTSPEGRAYAVFCLLRSYADLLDVVHFHDYKGLGFYCLNAKAQRISFMRTTLIVQAHGPTRWALESNGHPFTHEDQLKIDFLERGSIARADWLVSPSRYLLTWFKSQGWSTPSEGRVKVIQNVCLEPRGDLGSLPSMALPRPNEVVLFARHEARKGVVQFCDALDVLNSELTTLGIQVTFLGPLGVLNDEPSLVYLSKRAKKWTFPISVLPDFDRTKATSYLVSNQHCLVVVPSPIENSPYTVLEAITLGKPLLTSIDGGASELLDDESAALMTCKINGPGLAAAIRRVLQHGSRVPSLAYSVERTQLDWLALHKTCRVKSPSIARRRAPTVTAAITHFERPEKLFDALISLARQTYKNLEIIVVDDGSKSESTLLALERLEPLIKKLGAKLIRRTNGYLGAARNTAARQSNSDYLLFLDDDDIAFPTMIATLVEAAEATRADVMGCINLFMDVDRRAEAHPFPDMFPQKASYIPLGGPLSCAPLVNVFGSATCLIRRSIFEGVGGYTEDHGVGHEDFELYVRALQYGAKLEICPMPLFLYEVGRPSMSSATSKMRNWRRVARSVDAGAHPEAWADLAMLNAGQRAAAHAENFRIYHRSVDQHGELLKTIDSLSPASADYVVKVGELAHQLGATGFARALLSLSRRRSMVSSGSSHVEDAIDDILLVAVQTGSQTFHDTHVIAALVDLQLGRFAEASVNFGLSIERTRRLTFEHQRLFNDLYQTTNTNPDEIRPFIIILAKLPWLDLSNARFGALVFRLALRASAFSFVQKIVNDTLRADFVNYIDRYEDVASVVGAEQQACLNHYCQFGALENRTGFELSRLLVDIFCEEMAVKTSLSTFGAAVEALLGESLSPPLRLWAGLTEGDRLAAD